VLIVERVSGQVDIFHKYTALRWFYSGNEGCATDDL